MKILKEEGFGADCSSMAELVLSQRVGLPGDKIMFTSNDTPAPEFVKANELGAIVNLDDVSHIPFLEQNAGLPELVCFRYNPGPLKGGNSSIGKPEEAKYGFTRQQLFDGYKYLLGQYAPENILLMGESAGGNLVLALPQKLKDDSLPLPAGIVASSPVVQFLHYAYSYYECARKTDYAILFGINDVTKFYRGELPLDHPYLSPLCGDLRNYPPTYLDASNVESLRDEARMMFVRLREEGCDVEYHELKDFFHAMLTAPQYRFVRKEEHAHVLAFIHRVFEDKKR